MPDSASLIRPCIIPPVQKKSASFLSLRSPCRMGVWFFLFWIIFLGGWVFFKKKNTENYIGLFFSLFFIFNFVFNIKIYFFFFFIDTKKKKEDVVFFVADRHHTKKNNFKKKKGGEGWGVG